MSEYQLELKQIVDYPRCRIYRQFVQSLITDRNIRASRGSGLFYYCTAGQFPIPVQGWASSPSRRLSMASSRDRFRVSWG